MLVESILSKMKVLLLIASFVLAVSTLPLEEEHINGVNGWYVPQADGTLKWYSLEEGETLLQQGVSQRELSSEEERINGVNGWYVPQADGTMKWYSLEEGEALLLQATSKRDLFNNNVRFYLFTNTNPETPIEIMPTKESIEASTFNPANPTKFVIHGWTCDYLDESNLVVRDAWLSRGDFNIISVDWERARSKDYVSSVIAIPGAGQRVAAMINFMHESLGISLDDFEVIGHSLGAHVAGFTGKNVENGQVRSIIGLDAALPLFSYDEPNGRLSSTDARYVETIHTCGGRLGFLRPIGTASFYPNGGKVQPGCVNDWQGFCSHRRSFTYYAEAIERDTFPSYNCASHTDAVAQNCGSTFSEVRMSQPENHLKISGVFHVPIRETEPWGIDN